MGEISENYAENSAKSIENILKLNTSSWQLFVPLHKKQQLQEQSACCIGVKCLLNALGIDYSEVESVNTEWMSKNGQVPFLVGNNTSTDVFSGWRKILEMLESNQITLCPEPQRKEQKELLRMLDVLERVREGLDSKINYFYFQIELYHSWCDQTTVKNVTKGTR